MPFTGTLWQPSAWDWLSPSCLVIRVYTLKFITCLASQARTQRPLYGKAILDHILPKVWIHLFVGTEPYKFKTGQTRILSFSQPRGQGQEPSCRGNEAANLPSGWCSHDLAPHALCAAHPTQSPKGGVRALGPEDLTELHLTSRRGSQARGSPAAVSALFSYSTLP